MVCRGLAPFLSKTTVAVFVFLLEAVIRWWSWSAQYHHPVFKGATLSKGSVTVFLDELVRVQVFPSRFATSHEEEMINHQCHRVRKDKDSINEHGKGYTTTADRRVERDVVLTLV